VRFSFAETPGKHHISTPDVVLVMVLLFAASSAVNGCDREGKQRIGHTAVWVRTFFSLDVSPYTFPALYYYLNVKDVLMIPVLG